MKKRLMLLVAIAMMSTIVIVGCGKDNKENKDNKDLKVESNGQQKVEQAAVIIPENPEELKIKVTEEAKKIQDKVSFTDIAKAVNNNMTTITGYVNNNTSNVLTPYMNIYIYDKDKLIVTGNTFAEKVPANGKKQFVANLIGDYSKFDVKVELAELQ